MAAIKSYTDLQQSRKLAEILPAESADMCWTRNIDNGDITALHAAFNYGIVTIDYPCWSLTSLLSTFPVINSCTPSLRITITHEYYVEFCIDYFEKKRIITDYYESPVDACVAMIERLHELKIL